MAAQGNAWVFHGGVQCKQVIQQHRKHRFLPRQNTVAVGNDVDQRMLGQGYVKRRLGQ